MAKTGKKSRQRLALFFCPYCKKEVERQISSGERQKSCGCYRGKLIAISNVKLKTRHGYKGTRLYNVWATIKGRCRCKSSGAYPYYGAKGINVCDEWADDFVIFKDWALKNGYQKTLQIDRIDNDGNYCPENCQFITCAENEQKKPSCVLNWDLVEKIRELHRWGFKQNRIAEHFNIDKRTINSVVLRKSWKK